MRSLVVGYGSIGSRHARILEELGCSVAVVSKRKPSVSRLFPNIVEAVREFCPEYVVVADDTAQHAETITLLRESGFQGKLLIEKPLFHKEVDLDFGDTSQSFVAYNLRFHPLIRRLRTFLTEEKILSVHAYVGQYLPLWRPGRDYREIYSADREAGGGVLRDLSHELDLINGLFKGWRRMTALGGHLSRLEIASDDTYGIMIETRECPVVTLQMNYLDRLGRRRIIVNGEERTFELDFVAGRLMVNSDCEEFSLERDYTYREMHLALIEGRGDELCSFADGVEVVRMIAAAEQAVEEKRWVTR